MNFLLALRFDLLFILLDTVAQDNDKKIADHVVGIHQYRSPQEAEGAVTDHSTAISELETNKDKTGSGKLENDWSKCRSLL